MDTRDIHPDLMRWVRTPRRSRLLVGMLITSMLPTLFAPAGSAAAASGGESYARWIRAQLRIPVDEAVTEALSEAERSEPATLERFIEAFLDAYQAARPERPVALAFTDRELSSEALIAFLQLRYTQLVGDGVLPRTYLAAATALRTGTVDASTSAFLARSGSESETVSGADLAIRNADPVVIPFRLLSSAQPLGP